MPILFMLWRLPRSRSTRILDSPPFAGEFQLSARARATRASRARRRPAIPEIRGANDRRYGTPFSVFTPYRNAWLKKLDAGVLHAFPVARQADALALEYLVRAGYHPDGLLELMDVLRTLEREGGDDDLSAAPKCFFDGGGKLFLLLRGVVVEPVAVGAFNDHHVDVASRLHFAAHGRAEQGTFQYAVPPAQIRQLGLVNQRFAELESAAHTCLIHYARRSARVKGRQTLFLLIARALPG